MGYKTIAVDESIGPVGAEVTGVDLSQPLSVEVQQELNEPDLPWHTRRANVLVEGLVMTDLIGKTVQIGDVVVEPVVVGDG